MVAMVALQVLVTMGGTLGWTSAASLSLLAITLVVGFIFFRVESGNATAFVDFRLFRNATYTGATLSNLLLNAVAGIIIVTMTLVQVGAGMSAQEAGLLTLGYAVAIVLFIRVGERLLQRFGARNPMILGCADRRIGDPAADADESPARDISSPGLHCLHPLRHRAGVLRHTFHRRRALQPAG